MSSDYSLGWQVKPYHREFMPPISNDDSFGTNSLDNPYGFFDEAPKHASDVFSASLSNCLPLPPALNTRSISILTNPADEQVRTQTESDDPPENSLKKLMSHTILSTNCYGKDKQTILQGDIEKLYNDEGVEKILTELAWSSKFEEYLFTEVCDQLNRKHSILINTMTKAAFFRVVELAEALERYEKIAGKATVNQTIRDSRDYLISLFKRISILSKNGADPALFKGYEEKYNKYLPRRERIVIAIKEYRKSSSTISSSLQSDSRSLQPNSSSLSSSSLQPVSSSAPSSSFLQPGRSSSLSSSSVPSSSSLQPGRSSSSSSSSTFPSRCSSLDSGAPIYRDVLARANEKFNSKKRELERCDADIIAKTCAAFEADPQKALSPFFVMQMDGETIFDKMAKSINFSNERIYNAVLNKLSSTQSAGYYLIKKNVKSPAALILWRAKELYEAEEMYKNEIGREYDLPRTLFGNNKVLLSRKLNKLLELQLIDFEEFREYSDKLCCYFSTKTAFGIAGKAGFTIPVPTTDRNIILARVNFEDKKLGLGENIKCYQIYDSMRSCNTKDKQEVQKKLICDLSISKDGKRSSLEMLARGRVFEEDKFRTICFILKNEQKLDFTNSQGDTLPMIVLKCAIALEEANQAYQKQAGRALDLDLLEFAEGYKTSLSKKLIILIQNGANPVGFEKYLDILEACLTEEALLEVSKKALKDLPSIPDSKMLEDLTAHGVKRKDKASEDAESSQSSARRPKASS